jgi:hypothetical protein
MDLQHDQQRGRSPSTGHGPHISHSPSPHAPYDTTVHDQSFSTGAQLDSAQYLSSIQAPFLHTTQGLSQHNTPLFAPQSTNISPDPLDITAFSGQDFSSPDFSNQDYAFFPTQPQFNNTLDPHVLDHQQQQQQQQQQLSVNPNDLMTQMASQPAPTPRPTSTRAASPRLATRAMHRSTRVLLTTAPSGPTWQTFEGTAAPPARRTRTYPPHTNRRTYLTTTALRRRSPRPCSMRRLILSFSMTRLCSLGSSPSTITRISALAPAPTSPLA